LISGKALKGEIFCPTKLLQETWRATNPRRTWIRIGKFLIDLHPPTHLLRHLRRGRDEAFRKKKNLVSNQNLSYNTNLFVFVIYLELFLDIFPIGCQNSRMITVQKLLTDIGSLAARRDDRELLIILRRGQKHLEPGLAKELSKAISSAGGVGALRRFNHVGQLPVDSDSGMELLVVESSPNISADPILAPEVMEPIDRFIRERRHIRELRSAGVNPPTSLALMGAPGTGKTTLARWIAKSLDLPCMTLNLASVVTSYLGQTGQNIKKALDRGRVEPSILLLDEFDALARFRTDDNDVGEMKRVVTVLLQEIERWPDHSVLIAATNLPELVDPAFRRRFSRWVWLPLPEQKERFQILKANYKWNRISDHYLELAAVCMAGYSGADIANFANKVAARAIIDRLSNIEALWAELALEINEREIPESTKRQFIQVARMIDKKRFTYRKLGEFLGISHTAAIKCMKK
jgi:ATP-dependent 26S proteasome regulatory subunit